MKSGPHFNATVTLRNASLTPFERHCYADLRILTRLNRPEGEEKPVSVEDTLINALTCGLSGEDEGADEKANKRRR